MKLTLTIVGLGAALALAAPALAADIGIYLDPSGTTNTGSVNAFEEFKLYVIADGLTDLFGYKFTVQVPSSATVTDRLLAGPAPLNLGGGENFIVGTGGCMPESRVTLVTLTAMLFSSDDAVSFSLGAADPSSFSDEPGYLTCDSQLEAFRGITGASFNAEARSWGRLKTRYGN